VLTGISLYLPNEAAVGEAIVTFPIAVLYWENAGDSRHSTNMEHIKMKISFIGLIIIE